MPGLVPGIHVFVIRAKKTWMAGTSPAMTIAESGSANPMLWPYAIALPLAGRGEENYAHNA